MRINLMDIKTGQVKAIFRKILDGIHNREWWLDVEEVFDPDPDSYQYYYGLLAKRKEGDIVIEIYPGERPIHTPALSMTLENEDEYRVNEDDLNDMIKIPEFKEIISMAESMIKVKYAEMQMAEKREVRINKQNHLNEKAITLLNSL